MPALARDEPLLPRTNEGSDPDPFENIGVGKATTLILVVLLTCGILALVLSAVIWHFFDINENGIGGTTTTTFSPPECNKRLIGFYTEHESKEITKNQLGKLTHVVFSSVHLNSNGFLQFNNDKAQQRFTSLKSKSKGTSAKVMISIGGADNSEFFSDVIADSKKQKTFIHSILNFLQTYQIDGINLFWKWPLVSDKLKYGFFIKSLREILKKHYILSVVAPPVGQYATGFDLDEIIEYVDFINVFSMDYYGPWESSYGNPAGPTAPLYSGVGERKKANVDSTIRYYICETKKPSMFNIVIPFFARLWKNVNEAVEPGKEAFRNVELKDGKAEGSPYMSRWTVDHEGWKLTPSSWDEESKSSYIYDRDKRVYLTFETERSLAAKRNYIKEMNLGGLWIWSVDMDDEQNSLLNNITIDPSCSNGDEVKFAC